MALQLCQAPGALVRAGMAGAITGVDYRAALAIAPKGCDREALTALLLQAEAGALVGYAKASEKEPEQ